MIRVHVFCEGQTEELLIREILLPYFQRTRIDLNPIIIRTSPQGKGGVSSYGKIKWQIDKNCKEDPSAWVTTMLDFYGLPKDFPSQSTGGDSTDRARMIENAFQVDIGQKNFFANIIVHEFEGLLFSDPRAFGSWFDDREIVDSISQIKQKFETPEHIDDGQHSAPSKRILEICETYDKVLHGSLIALDIGLDSIRKECPRFDLWIKKIESLVGETN